MASQLGTYNKALEHLEQRPLASLAENREPRRLLDGAWDDSVAFITQDGNWKHALRTVKAQPDSNRVPSFGRKYVYTKPMDWVRTYQLSSDDRFVTLDKYFIDEGRVWYSDLPYFFVRYVSNGTDYGLNMAAWGEAFANYLAGYLARKIAPRIQQSMEKKDDLDKTLKKLRSTALSIDAMNEPPGRIPHGTWVTSRTPRGSVLPTTGGWDD